MMPAPLNHLRDERRAPQAIAGHYFDPVSGKCSCDKVYSDVSGVPIEAVNDDKQAGMWCHQGTMNMREYLEIQAENERIFACARS